MMPAWTPHWVRAILEWRWISLLARIALTSAYIVGGLTKLFDFSAAVAEQQHFGFHPGWIWAVLAIVIELLGPVLIISGRWVWLGAGALGVLTAIASLAANNFWDLEGHARFVALNSFFEHIGLIAGLVLAAVMAESNQRRPLRLN
jgi:uncharacterized membrane protein YphA (DoxX/SURF4 family)